MNGGSGSTSLKTRSIRFYLFLALILCVCSTVAATTPDEVPVQGIVWGPYITGTSPFGTIIHVKTVLPANVSVQYATEEQFTRSGSYDHEVTLNGTANLLHIPLTGLAPGTRYHYRVVYDGRATGDCHFLTFPESGSFTFVVYGDSRDQLPVSNENIRHRSVAEMIAREPDVSFVLHTGDIVTDKNNPADWDRFFSAAGEMLANTTLVPVMGNHEQGTELWQEVFGTAPVYSFDCGDAHITVINSNDDVWNTIGCQTAWLASDLTNAKPWRFVALHHPMYSSEEKHFGGWTNLRNEWESTFDSKDVTAVFQGHVHAYERDIAGGIFYITEARGGSPFYALNATKITGYQNSRENSLGYTRVQVNPAMGTATADVINVADFSTEDNSLLVIHPAGTVFETFELKLPVSIQPPLKINTTLKNRGIHSLFSGYAPFSRKIFSFLSPEDSPSL